MKPKQQGKVFKLKDSIIKQLKEDKHFIPHLYLETDIPMSTLKRWINNNDEKLTMYVILLAISEITQTAITELVEIEEINN